MTDKKFVADPDQVEAFTAATREWNREAREFRQSTFALAAQWAQLVGDRHPVVAAYAGAREEETFLGRHRKDALKMGQLFADVGARLVTGGAPGVMRLMLEEHERAWNEEQFGPRFVMGVRIRGTLDFDEGDLPQITHLVEAPDFACRIHLMSLCGAHGALCFAGGAGTDLERAWECQHSTATHHRRPLVQLNSMFWAGTAAQQDAWVAHGAIERTRLREYVHYVDEPEAALALFLDSFRRNGAKH